MRYASLMLRRGIIPRLRALITAVFRLKSKEAVIGKWWEIDLIIVILGGIFALGIAAIIQL